MKRVVVAVGGVLVIVLVTGVAYEQIMRARVATEYPPPGRMVDVGGRRMQIDCRGSGSPTVVFESGLDAKGSLSWSAVHDVVAENTRACAYSRAGLVWSDRSAVEFKPQNVATDLHTLLIAAGEHAPFVMVGHSLGGPYIMTFTRLFPQEVAGLVFVDCSHPDQIVRLQQAIGRSLDEGQGEIELANAISWSGIPRLMAPKSDATGAQGHADTVENAYLSQSIGAVWQESRNVAATLASGGKLRQLDDRPLIVLTAAKPLPEPILKMLKLTARQGQMIQSGWKDMQDDEASWSHRSRHELVADSSHYIQFERPDVVIAAVKEVVGEIRAVPND